MERNLTLALPKGRIENGVELLLADCGIGIRNSGRSYRPRISESGIEAKYLKPQNIPKLVEIGAHDCGFTGHDWIVESGADVVDVLDTELNPVRLVAAAPEQLAGHLSELDRPVIVASEFETLARRWADGLGRPYVFIRTFGATEVFPPEDADVILDLTETGATLKENRLVVVDEVLVSSTRFVASKAALDDPARGERIDGLRTLMKATLEGRRRVLIEMNVPSERLDQIVAILPAMKSPTIQKLFGEDGYAVKAAVPRTRLPGLILDLRKAGATDLIVCALEKVIP